MKNGFEEVEKALPDFSLLVKKFKKSAPAPSFKGQWDKKRNKFGKGLTIITSGQCPQNVQMVSDIAEIKGFQAYTLWKKSAMIGLSLLKNISCQTAVQSKAKRK